MNVNVLTEKGVAGYFGYVGRSDIGNLMNSTPFDKVAGKGWRRSSSIRSFDTIRVQMSSVMSVQRHSSVIDNAFC